MELFYASGPRREIRGAVSFSISVSLAAPVIGITMKPPALLLTILFSIVGVTAQSQTFYQLEYSLQKGKGPTTYSAFFVKYEIDEGFIRIKYASPETNDTILVQMDVSPQYTELNGSNADTGRQFYKLTSPRVIKGTGTPPFDSLLICFKINPSTRIPEPWGITVSNSTKEEDYTIFTGKEPISNDALKSREDFIRTWFVRKDIFLKNIFPTTSRSNSMPDFTNIEKNTKFYLLIVADTKDSAIGKACAVDKTNIENDFTFITDKFLGTKPIIKTLHGDNLSKTNVEKAIREIMGKVTPQDIFVFFYSGHGFRLAGDTSTFPRMKLWPWNTNNNTVWKEDSLKTGFVNDNSLALDYVFNAIKNKTNGARLNLIISDCCNTINKSTKPEYRASTGRGPAEAFVLNPNNQYFRQLFLNPKQTTIRITAADKGQEAPANDEKGGCLTKNFQSTLATFLDGTYLNPVNWEDLCKKAKSKTATSAKTVKKAKTGTMFIIDPYFRID